VAVNRSWDDHCKQLESSHTRQMAALKAELSDVRQRLDERQKCDSERETEFDELLLSAKKQREDEEVPICFCLSLLLCRLLYVPTVLLMCVVKAVV